MLWLCYALAFHSFFCHVFFLVLTSSITTTRLLFCFIFLFYIRAHYCGGSTCWYPVNHQSIVFHPLQCWQSRCLLLTVTFSPLQLVGRRALALCSRSLASSVWRGDAYRLHGSPAAAVQVHTESSIHL